jgi:spore coat protein H
MHPFGIPAFVSLLVTIASYSQPVDSIPAFPEFRIYLSKDRLRSLQSQNGEKVDLSQGLMLLNQDTVVLKEMHSRGRTTLTFVRKSLSVDLDKSVTITSSTGSIKIKKFDLLNLVMDRNLWHNRWAFMNLAELGLFPLFNTYCKLWINDQPQGFYLLVEKPNHYTAHIKSPYMVRRGAKLKIDQEYPHSSSKEEVRQFKERYLSLYKSLNRYQHQELFAYLQDRLNLTSYFRWLAFNYFVMNGDYSDEVYFYVPPDFGKFEIIPWDYDDLFRREPHEGAHVRQAQLKDRLVFSLEDDLDRKIAADDVLYARYRVDFKQVLLDRDPESLQRTFDQVLHELELISNDPTLNAASRFLDKHPFVLEQAKEDLRVAATFLHNQRIVLLKALE